ncbi:MAG: GH36-type glycosyl hydrolase domain-containing protein [Candidatus Fimimonas sp.]
MKNGYFDDKNKEYVITDMFPRREWLNYLWNDETVCAVTQFGDGNVWSKVGKDRRQIDMGERLIYIKDRDNGDFYCANRNYRKEPFNLHQCKVGLGYHKVISEYKGLRTEYTLVVPVQGKVLLQQVNVTNISSQTKNTDIVYLCRPCPTLAGHDYGEADKALSFNGLIYSYLGYAIPMPYRYVYVAADKPFDGYEVWGNRFRGNYNGYDNPVALQCENLASQGINYGSDYVGALSYKLSLQPQETFSVSLAVGTATCEKECAEFARYYTEKGAFDRELQLQIQKNASYTDIFTLNSPDAVLNSQVNVWLKRQLTLGKDWGRVYGKGFRDVMQDTTAFVSMDVACARGRILTVLKHQYEDGNPIRMFEPDFYYPYNDGAVWIPSAVLTYVNESGDLSVLDEKIPYLNGKSSEHVSLADSFVNCDYVGTEYVESVYTHVKKAMDYLFGCRGEHGLVLFLGGDWNDSMNSVGLKKRGESVWLTIATVKAYNEFIEILKLCGKTSEAEIYAERKNILSKAVLQHGSDDDHLIYGYNDDGVKIGASSGESAQIFLNPQTWAVMAQLTDKKTLEKYMDAVENKLQCEYGYLQCYPCYKKGDDSIGRISYLKPGLVENGAVYNHGVAFKIVADCMLNRGDAAYKSLLKIRFDNPSNPDNGMEPYAVSNMYIGPENKYLSGFAPMSWITGTAGWLYRAITEYVCGVRASMEGLKIAPCFPSHWNNVTCVRKFRNCTYTLDFRRSDKFLMTEGGESIVGNTIKINQKKERHVTIYFG